MALAVIQMEILLPSPGSAPIQALGSTLNQSQLKQKKLTHRRKCIENSRAAPIKKKEGINRSTTAVAMSLALFLVRIPPPLSWP